MPKKILRSICISTLGLFFCFSSIVFAAADTAAAVKPSVTKVVPGNVYIPKGTMIQAELITGVNSGKNNVGDIATFKFTENLVINGVVVIAKGTAGEAVVTKVKRAGAWGKGGGIDLEAKSTRTINQTEVPLSLDTKKYGGGQGMVVPWLLVGVFSGFVRGKNQDIPIGTKFSVAIDSDVDLGVPPEKLAEAMKSIVTVQVVENTESMAQIEQVESEID